MLKAQHRWCLTGSPIFNRVHDLHALLKFLKIYPFDLTSYFNSHTTNLLKTDEKKALENLKKLFHCVALRRTKSAVADQLQLTSRVDKVQEVEFFPQERTQYEVLKRSLSYFFHSSEVDVDKSESNGNVLQTITRLRRFCDHGLDLLPSEIRMVLKRSTNEKEIAQVLVASLKICEICNVQPSNQSLSKLTVKSFPCGHSICSRCLSEQQAMNNDCLWCFGLEVSQLSTNGATYGKPEERYGNYRPSSKVITLLENLSAEKVADPAAKRFPDLRL